MGAAHIELPERFNLAAAMIDARLNEGKGNKAAIYYKDRTFSYSDIQQMVNMMGNVLISLGIEMEDRLAILMPDSPEWIACFFGAVKIGAVAAPFNTLLKAKDYEYLLNDSRTKVIIVSDDLVGQIEGIRRNLKYLKHIVVVGKTEPGQLSYEQLLGGVSAQVQTADTSKDDPAFWLYTSGTTGVPKGVVHLQHDLLFQPTLYSKNHLGLNDSDVILSVPKLFFSLGLANLGGTFYIGAAQILLPEKTTPRNVLEAITKYRPTVFIGVPTLVANMLTVENLGGYDLSSLRICVTGGEPLPAGIFWRFKERFGIEVLEVFGSAEAMTGFIAGRPGRARPGFTGEQIAGIDLKIVNSEGKEVPEGEPGELLVSVDSSSPCYWNKHEETKETMIGNWLRTGDIVQRDKSGYYRYIGRVDDIIEAGGIKVAPAEVEAALIEHPAVVEAAVVGAPDEHGIEKPKAFVILNRGYQPSPQLALELQQFVKSKIAPYNYPRWVEFVDELPKTATGKIQRFKLR